MGTSIELGEYELDLTRGLLLRAGVKVPIRPKCFAVLLYLIRAYPRAVSIGELRTNVWKVQVGDGAIRDVILDIRRCLGDQGPPWRWIDGSPGIGYWLCESPSAPRAVAAALDPARVRATVSRRSSECQELLRAACVVGLEPRTRVLQLMLGWGIGPLLAALDEAKRFDLILPASAPDSHRFADPVAQETLYAGLGADARMDLHLRAGEALEATLAPEDPQRLGLLAYHFGRSAPVGGAERAVLFGREAAARALRVAAFAEAASLLEGALQAFEHLPARDPLLRAEFMIDLGAALAGADAALGVVQETLGEAIELAEAGGAAALVARGIEQLVVYSHRKDTLASSRSPRALEMRDRYAPALRQALQQIDPDREAGLYLRSVLALAALHNAASDATEAERHLDVVLAFDGIELDASLHAEALHERFLLGGPANPVLERESLLATLVETSRSAHRPDLELRAHFGRMFLGLEHARREWIDSAGSSIEEIAASTRAPEAPGARCTWRALSAQLAGRFEEADLESEEAARFDERIRFTPLRTAAVRANLQWWLALLRGEAAAAVPQWEGFRAYQPAFAPPRFYLARLYIEQGRGAEALELLDGLDPVLLRSLPVDDLWLFLGSLAAEICGLLGERAAAGPILELYQGYADRAATAGRVLICTGALGRPLGYLAALLGEFGLAERLFGTAKEHAKALGAPVLELLVEADRARALLLHPERRVRARGCEAARRAMGRCGERGLRGVERWIHAALKES